MGCALFYVCSDVRDNGVPATRLKIDKGWVPWPVSTMPTYKIGDYFYSVASSSLEISNEKYTFVRLIPAHAIVCVEYLENVSITLTIPSMEPVRILSREEDCGDLLERLYKRISRMLS